MIKKENKITKIMTVVVKDDRETFTIKSEYETKQAFIDDLHANGYTVVGRISVEGEDNERTRLYDRGIK